MIAQASFIAIATITRRSLSQSCKNTSSNTSAIMNRYRFVHSPSSLSLLFLCWCVGAHPFFCCAVEVVVVFVTFFCNHFSCCHLLLPASDCRCLLFLFLFSPVVILFFLVPAIVIFADPTIKSNPTINKHLFVCVF